MAKTGAADNRIFVCFEWLPAGTAVRFAILVAATLGSSVFLFTFLGTRLTDVKEQARSEAACRAANPSDPLRCSEPGTRRNLQWDLFGVAGILLGAAATYRLAPFWVLRRHHLVLMGTADVPEVTAYLNAALPCTSLGRLPTVYWNPLNGAVNGLAFGTRHRPCIGLSGGLVTLLYVREKTFRAVILHELAHWTLGDVPVTYFTTSIWIVFVVGALLPAAVGLIGQSLESVLHVGLRMTAIGGVVYLARNAVLRSREYYADLAAAREPAAAEELARLAGNPRGRLSSWFGVHPEPEQRRARLRAPAQLLQQNPAEAFGVGVVSALGFSTTAMAMADITVAFRSELASLIGLLRNLPWHLAASVFTPLLTFVVGTATWRRAFCNEAKSASLGAIVGNSILTGAGFVVGEQLALDSQLSWEQTNYWGSAAVILINLVGATVIAAVLGLLFAWHYAAACGWLRTGLSRASFRSWFVLSLASSIPALILCFGEVLALRLYIDGPPLDIANFVQLKIEVTKIIGTLISDIPIPFSLVKAFAAIAVGIPAIGVIAGLFTQRRERQ